METRGYYAVAKVERVVADPVTPNMYFALIELGSYLDFATPVPFADHDGPLERGVLNEAGRISGRAQAAVRGLSPSDFTRIVTAGLADENPLLPRTDFAIAEPALREGRPPFVFDEARERVSAIVSRVVRDRVFRRIVLRAYDERCAVTGLKLINGGGRAEVEAAHIRPVEANGPDIVSNGLALSGTAHWMFDRGLIGLDDNMRIIISRQANDPESVRSVINASGQILIPQREADRPHLQFVRWNREHCFKH